MVTVVDVGYADPPVVKFNRDLDAKRHTGMNATRTNQVLGCGDAVTAVSGTSHVDHCGVLGTVIYFEFGNPRARQIGVRGHNVLMGLGTF
jgi:hypothetical protein